MYLIQICVSMQHICTRCIDCKREKACIDCALSQAYKISEYDVEAQNKLQITYAGELTIKPYPFEVERLSRYRYRVSHPFINCSELNLAPLLINLIGASDGTIEMDPTYSPLMLKIVSRLVGNETTFLIDDISQIICQGNNYQTPKTVWLYDARETHLLPFQTIFQHFSKGHFFISDIHDLTHHGLQTSQNTDFVRLLGEFGIESIEMKSKYSQDLAIFLLYACLEYAIIVGKKNPYSNGCLNWQEPRKSPAERSQYQPMCTKCLSKWNCARGLNSLYRRQTEVSNNHQKSINWLQRLGYYWEYTDLKIDSKDLKITNLAGPKSFLELLERGTALIAEARGNL